MMKKILLGDLLVKNNIISHRDLESALQQQQVTGKRLGKLLVDLKLMDETDLQIFLANQLHFPYLDLSHYPIKPEVIREVPEIIARRLNAIPIDRIDNGFLVAMSDPTNLSAYDELLHRLKKTMHIVIVKESDIIRVIDEVFTVKVELTSLVGKLEKEIHYSAKTQDSEENLQDAPIKQIINSLFEDALVKRASDIHIEPTLEGMRIRQRIDGVLHEQAIWSKAIIGALILRLKLMAKLNISQRRLPQDGRFSLILQNRKIDVRISTMPQQNGESVTLRLLDPLLGLLPLKSLGMSEAILKKFKEYLSRSNGLILVTGPTGSGKTTTLYAALAEINATTKKIFTVEDPIEYSIEHINQVQVQPSIGLSFAPVLRSVLRHDPDIIMIGEIRDEETAQIALRAAMTGHLVLSTLHTNDVLSVPARLCDMGIEPYLAANAMGLILSQRLLKRACIYCNKDALLTPEQINILKKMQIEVNSTHHFIETAGCIKCDNRGYTGRIGVYELLVIDSSMEIALREKDFNRFAELGLQSRDYHSLMESAFEYAASGIITITELLKMRNEINGFFSI